MVKSLSNKDIDNLIDGLENGNIIIDGRNTPKMSEEEVEEYRKLRQEYYDAMTYDEKQEMKKLIENLLKN